MLQAQPVALSLPGRVNPLRAMVLCALAAAVVASVPFVQHAGLYLTVLGMGTCVAIPLWRDWVRGQLDFFEPVHLIGFIWFFYFGMGSIWTVLDPGTVAYDLALAKYVPQAAFYCLLGYLAFLAGYYGPWHQPRVTFRNLHERPRGPIFLMAVGGLGLAGFMAVGVWTSAVLQGVKLPGAVSSLSQFSPLFFFAWALAWLLYFRGMLTGSLRWNLFGFMIPAVLMIGFLTFSDKSLALTLVGIPLICRYYITRKLPWKTLLILLIVLVFVVFPLYNTFRRFDPSRGQGERIGMAYQTMQEWNTDSYLKFSLGTFQRRLAMVNSVALVIRDVGRWEPYARGSTIFMPGLAFFVPRILWPDKPHTTLGQEFGRKFRVTNYWTRRVFIGVTIPGELYWNFALPGIILGMALIGSVVRWLYARYSPRDGPVSGAIQVVLLIDWAHYFGGQIAAATVATIRTLIVIEVLRWIGHNYGLLARRPE